MSSKDMHGEGNEEAAKQYNDQTREFIKDGKVKDAAEKAEPESQAEKSEIEEAERVTGEHKPGQKPESASN